VGVISNKLRLPKRVLPLSENTFCDMVGIKSLLLQHNIKEKRNLFLVKTCENPNEQKKNSYYRSWLKGTH
jgi:hypothetical protein